MFSCVRIKRRKCLADAKVVPSRNLSCSKPLLTNIRLSEKVDMTHLDFFFPLIPQFHVDGISALTRLLMQAVCKHTHTHTHTHIYIHIYIGYIIFFLKWLGIIIFLRFVAAAMLVHSFFCFRTPGDSMLTYGY